MKKNKIVLLIIMGMSLFGFLQSYERAWGDWHSADGGSAGGGSGTTSEPCSGKYDIISTNCGSRGGGKSWRVFKLTKETDTIKELNNYNKTKWQVDISKADTTTQNAVKSLIKQCANEDYPYVMLFGLNRVANNDSQKKFFVMFNQSSPNGDCMNNRGCYYNWNNTNAITKVSKVAGAKSGKIIQGNSDDESKNIAYQLYKKERKDISFDKFKNKIGGFCTKLGEVLLIAYARDEKGNLLDNEPIDTDSTPKNEEATVTTGSGEFSPPSGYKFIGWSKDETGSSVLSTKTSYSEVIKKQTKVYAVYSPESDIIPGECESWTPSSYKNSYSNADGGEGTTSTVTRIRNLSLGEGWKEEETFAKPTDQIGWIHCYYPGVQKVADNLITPDTHKSGEGNSCDKFSTSCSSPSSYSLNNKPFKSYIPWSNKYTVSRDFSNNKTVGNWSGAVGDAAAQKYDDNYIIEPLAASKTLTETIKTDSPIWAKVWKVHGPNSWGCVWAKYGQEKTGEKEVNCKTDKDGKRTCDKEDIMTDVYSWSSTCSHSETYYEKDFDSGPTDSKAWVKIPYNYELSSELDESNLKKDYYAGELVDNIKSWSFVNPRQNNVTSGYYGEYATVARDVKKRLRVCVKDGSNNCYYTDPESVHNGGVLNQEGLMDGVTERISDDSNSETMSFNVPDVTAGTEICISSGLFPKDSGEDKNIKSVWDGYNVNNTEHWAWSEPICVRVSKRPSMQVIGGNVYSAGSIVTSLSTKNLIAGHYGIGHSLSNPSGAAPRTFGSWGELGVIAKGSVKGFASGASLGYVSLDVTALSPDPFVASQFGNPQGGNPGGNSSSQYCDALSPLTIAGSCKNEFGGYGNQGNSDNRIVLDYNSIKAMAEGLKWRDNKNGTGVVIKNGEIKGNTDGTGAISYERNQFDIISSKDNIKIMHNIKISDEAYFETLSQIPKLVIYTEKDIEIGCEVERIDAILVAGGTVSTCKVENSGGLDDHNREKGDENLYDGVENHEDYSKKQLVVNGAIIAKKLDASRTYGASTGSNSMIPAELINFDPTLYLWNTAAADASGNNKEMSGLKGDLTVTFINELAPRY